MVAVAVAVAVATAGSPRLARVEHTWIGRVFRRRLIIPLALLVDGGRRARFSSPLLSDALVRGLPLPNYAIRTRSSMLGRWSEWWGFVLLHGFFSFKHNVLQLFVFMLISFDRCCFGVNFDQCYRSYSVWTVQIISGKNDIPLLLQMYQVKGEVISDLFSALMSKKMTQDLKETFIIIISRWMSNN